MDCNSKKTLFQFFTSTKGLKKGACTQCSVSTGQVCIFKGINWRPYIKKELRPANEMQYKIPAPGHYQKVTAFIGFYSLDWQDTDISLFAHHEFKCFSVALFAFCGRTFLFIDCVMCSSVFLSAVSRASVSNECLNTSSITWYQGVAFAEQSCSHSLGVHYNLADILLEHGRHCLETKYQDFKFEVKKLLMKKKCKLNKHIGTSQ